jgi:HK97 family phage prohead protease
VTILDLTTSLDFREATDNPDVAATFEGLAVPYGEAANLGGIREAFGPDAFDPAAVIGKPLCWRHGEPVGRITDARNESGGLWVRGDIANTGLGRDTAVMARMGIGLSVGFEPNASTWNRAKDFVTHTRATLGELSFTHMPAYASAGVTTTREETPMSDTDTTATVTDTAPAVEYATREEVLSLRERIASMDAPVSHTEAHPLAAFRSLGEYCMAVYKGQIETRAIIDQITVNNPGVMAPKWVSEVQGIVSHGRPGITALGVEPAGANGMDINWPYFDGDLDAIVAVQAAQKTDVNSVRIDIKKGAASLVTYAAASDISYQLLMRSSPSYLDAHNRIMSASYAAVTDNAFVDALVAGGTASAVDYDLAGDTDGKAFRHAVFAASVEVESATGSPATVVLVATDVFGKIGGWDGFVPSPYGTYNVPGTATASTLAVSVSGLSVTHDRHLAAGTILVTNGLAASWVEDGPMFADAEVPTRLGRDVAIFGFGTTAIYLPKGVVKVTNLP